METPKQEVQEILNSLPEDATLDEIQYRIYVRQAIDRGLQDIEQGANLDSGSSRAADGKVDQVIIWTESATADLESIVEYIYRDSEFYAAAIARELVSAASSLATLASRGRTVPEYQTVQIRELIVRR